jgi:hypothetical protein
MAMPTTPHVMAASPPVAASPTSLSAVANDEEKEAPVSSFYCQVHFKSEKA